MIVLSLLWSALAFALLLFVRLYAARQLFCQLVHEFSLMNVTWCKNIDVFHVVKITMWQMRRHGPVMARGSSLQHSEVRLFPSSLNKTFDAVQRVMYPFITIS